MPEAAPAPAPSPSPAPDPAATAWHAGIEPETLGFWQNKGYDVTDPKKLASELTKQYREAERFIGAPPDQILRLPKADAKPEDWKAFHQRLGAPADPKEYDFSSVKFAGNDLEQSFTDAMREGLAAAFVPKDRAATIVASVVKYLESAETQEATITGAKLAEERSVLEKNWGGKDSPTFQLNHLRAMEGAQRLGITPEAVKALEGQIGYAAVMEAMRKIGAGTSEDTFIERGITGSGNPTTREGAMARKAELMADKAWGDRYLAGGLAERQEMDRLNIMIDGVAA